MRSCCSASDSCRQLAPINVPSCTAPDNLAGLQLFPPLGTNVTSLTIGQSVPFGTSLFVNQRGQVKVTVNFVITVLVPTGAADAILSTTFNIVRDGTTTLTNGEQTLASRITIVDVSLPVTITVMDPAVEPGLHHYSIILTNESEPSTAVVDLASVIISAKTLSLPTASATSSSFFVAQEYPERGTSAITLAPSQTATRNLLVLLPVAIINPIPVRLEFNANLLNPVGTPGGVSTLDLNILGPDGTSVTNGPQRISQSTIFGAASVPVEVNTSFFVTDRQSNCATPPLAKQILYTLVLTNTSPTASTFDIDFFSFSAETATSLPWYLADRSSTVFTNPHAISLPGISSALTPCYCPWTIGPFAQYFPPNEQNPIAIVQNSNISLNLAQVITCGLSNNSNDNNSNNSDLLAASKNGTFTSGSCCEPRPVRLIGNLNFFGDVAHTMILYDFRRDGASLINGMQLLSKGIVEAAVEDDGALVLSCVCIDTNPPPGKHDYSLLIANLGLGTLYVDYGSFMIDA